MNEAKNKITINGRSLPVRVTMGALLRFKRATGKEAHEINGDLEDAVTFMHCCVESACRADGIPFEMDVETMADHLSVEDVTNFTKVLLGSSDGGDGSKKK